GRAAGRLCSSVARPMQQVGPEEGERSRRTTRSITTRATRIRRPPRRLLRLQPHLRLPQAGPQRTSNVWPRGRSKAASRASSSQQPRPRLSASDIDSVGRERVMAENSRAGVLERALEAAVTGDAGALPELFTEDVSGWSPNLMVGSLAELTDAVGA